MDTNNSDQALDGLAHDIIAYTAMTPDSDNGTQWVESLLTMDRGELVNRYITALAALTKAEFSGDGG